MKLLVIDGQGGGVGRSLVAALKQTMPEQPVIALGANAQASTAMLRAGADQCATGESAIRYQCKSAIAAAVSESEAEKVLVPMERCGLRIAGVGKQPLDALIREAVRIAAELIGQAEA